jgi:hypothetical protein
MTPKDFIHEQTFNKFINLGYTERDSTEVAISAVRLFGRQSRGINSIEEAIAAGKKQFSKVKK